MDNPQDNFMRVLHTNYSGNILFEQRRSKTDPQALCVWEWSCPTCLKAGRVYFRDNKYYVTIPFAMFTQEFEADTFDELYIQVIDYLQGM